jgi:YHS domain-containing protein
MEKRGRKMLKDPICGMTVKEERGIRLNYQGQTYYFSLWSRKSGTKILTNFR